jgi:transposase
MLDPTAVEIVSFSVHVLQNWGLPTLIVMFGLVIFATPFAWRFRRHRVVRDLPLLPPSEPIMTASVVPVADPVEAAPVVHPDKRVERESRRLYAWELYQQGVPQAEIARQLQVSRGAVCQWVKAARDSGGTGLHRRKTSGRPCRLSPEDNDRLLGLLTLQPRELGLTGGTWTYQRIADLIMREFGVQFHPAHVARLMHNLGWRKH